MRNRAPASVTFVLVTLGLDALGVGIIAPIVPQLVQQLGHLSPDRAAPWVGTLLAVYAAVQFFAAPILGGLSDRFGRRPIILASVFGLGCDYVLLAFAPNLWWLFAGAVGGGCDVSQRGSRDCLHRRCFTGRRPTSPVWACRRDVRGWVCHWPGARRPCWVIRPPSPLHDCSRSFIR